MKVEDCFYLGYVARVHGYKGELSFFLDVTQPAAFKDVDVVLVMVDQTLIPFPLERRQLEKGKYLRCKLVGVDTEQQARKLMKAEAYLPLHMLPEESDKEVDRQDAIGYTVEDKTRGPIGVVDDIYDLKGNPLISVVDGEKEYLIPAHDEFILEVDRENRRLKVDCPEGLLDL